MKVKELDKTVQVAWSPEGLQEIMIAAGTAAQQLDCTFNTNAALEIYSLNLTEPGQDMQLRSQTLSDNR
jgi:protein transport protein SEC31